jgi:hypothetical protein
MSSGPGIEAAIATVAATAEVYAGTRFEKDVEPDLVQWAGERGLLPASSKQFEALRRCEVFDSLKLRMGAIWWPPLIDTGEQPIVVGLTRQDQEFGIRIALIRWLGTDARGFGMRFEEPHRGSDAHCFRHAQLWAELHRKEETSRLADPEAWVPEKQPSFPLQAADALELLWAAAVSIYGKAGATAPFVGDQQALTKLGGYLNSLA